MEGRLGDAGVREGEEGGRKGRGKRKEWKVEGRRVEVCGGEEMGKGREGKGAEKRSGEAGEGKRGEA